VFALVVALHIIACLFLIAVVLLQQGKGADLASAFGGGTQTVFGARGSVTLLHKLTTTGFVIFILTSIFLGIAERRGSEASVMKDVKAPAAQSGSQPKPADQKPAQTPSAAPAPQPAAPQTPPAK
jgi:preprotein translocase subunit SecG